MKIIGSLRRNETGASAVEFALVVPIFILMVIGGFYAAFAAFTASSMHRAVEAGARCASITKTVCSSTAATVTYTQGKFVGIGAAPTFVASSAACGQRVTGTVSLSMDLGLKALDVPLSAEACYP